MLAIAGAEVPTRPATARGRRPGRQNARAKRARWTGEWRDAKGCRFSLRAADRLVQVLSWPQGQTDAEAAAARRQVKAAGVLPEERVRLGVLADGALWLWQQAQALCPAAVEPVDYDHGSAHRHKVAVLHYGAPPEPHQAWYEAALARLCWGEVHGVIGGLQRMQPTAAQAAAEIDSTHPVSPAASGAAGRPLGAQGRLSHGQRWDGIGQHVQLPGAPQAVRGLVVL